MSYEMGLSIEKVAGVTYPQDLKKLLYFDDYIGCDTYTPIFWCNRQSLDDDFRWSFLSKPNEDDTVTLVPEDIDKMIEVLKYRCDKFKKMKHLLIDYDEAEELVEEWQMYEKNIDILIKIKEFMLSKAARNKKIKVFYYTSY